MIGPDTRPAIAPLYRLQFEPVPSTWLLMHPAGTIELNLPAAEILRRCDGQRSVRQIVGELEQAFGSDGLADDVCRFLDEARGRGWVCRTP